MEEQDEDTHYVRCCSLILAGEEGVKAVNEALALIQPVSEEDVKQSAPTEEINCDYVS